MLEVLKIEKVLLSTNSFSMKYLITITNKETNYSTNFTYIFCDNKEPEDIKILDNLINESRYGFLSLNDFIKNYESLDFTNIDLLLEEHNHCVLLKNKLSDLYPNYLEEWSVV